ncbi:MAG: hypothetical protein R6U00_09165 [Prochlorococcaceae cyanobacterium]
MSTAPQVSDPLPFEATPWAVQRLRLIFEQITQSPNQQALQDAQAARLCFTRFWLSAPVDHLEVLYRGPIGEAYRLMLRGVLPALPLSAEDERWKKGLSQRLQKGFGGYETTNLLLAVMPFFDLNTMKVADPLRQIPEWLLNDYAERCDPMLLEQLRARQGSVGQSTPQLNPSNKNGTLPAGSSPALQRGLPLFWEQGGKEALNQITDPEFLGRMSGIINLYAIDPKDNELKGELARLRRMVAQVWLDLETEQVQSLYRTPFGQLTQNLVGSGFYKEPLSDQERNARAELGQILAEMRHPKAVNALIAALLYYPPSKVNLRGGEKLIPGWLLQEITALQNRMMAS